jgi:putative polyhydroxyalkanoate system protein
MSKPLCVNVPHNLGKEEARRRIEEGVGRLRTQLTGGMAGMLGMKERWEGDQLNLEASGLGQVMNARIKVLADSVQLEIDLPEFLAAIAEKIKSRITTETKLLLENK